MRMIREMIRLIAKVFFNKEYLSYELPKNEEYKKTDYIYKDIMNLLDQGKINEAENLLFDRMDTSDKRYMELALDFYERINSFHDKFLEDHNFSREEIKEGLLGLAKEFGLPLSDILL